MATDMIPPAGAAVFLAAHGWAGAEIAPLAGDASFRRYFRITHGARRAVLMDAPPPHEDPRPFITIARWLSERGFAAPVILAADEANGLVLIEDFGDDRMREAIETDPDATMALYASAIDLLVALRGHEAMLGLRPYDRTELQREAGLLVDWYCPAVGLEVDAAGYRAAWDAVLERALVEKPVTVLRDYHAENLMLIPAGLGLLDFQDALAGHPAYDLVSLLQDARRDVEPAIEEAMLARYRAATGEGEAFLDAYHVLGAQRNAKIIGIFTRLWKRDGKPRYPTMCPRVWSYLERDLSYPVLGPVAAWFDANIPPELRGDPMMLAGQ
ncbi:MULTISPECIES: aminoglycoside phosphotransferase family protein [Sphingomonas]|uniref:Phosphotransferase n=1 Tax=Sphingomonas lycopersici TaxID=2951807 RepID=A0AA42CTP8_9SPHN|nr:MULTISPECIES: phosphotransferase [Sphingomonas]MCW6529486.1 phosphotransferase [Sphingomonas lycopersici]MCW6534591.1 phosphotransferase [Sphingomonas lycopersici]OJU23142.1 MAG: aminoglycoside phosphotransferase [Sphingomonas sp. 66-10]